MSRSGGDEFVRRFDVLGCRIVACLARDTAVIGLLVLIIDILVAVNARRVTCVVDPLGGDLVNGICPIVAVLTERMGDKHRAGRDECCNG